VDVRSLHQASFVMYVDTLRELAVWFHVLEHTNYGCWIPVHLRDMVELSSAHPEIAQEFRVRNFTVQETNRPFPATPVDQAHKQNTAAIKGDGGAVGLTDNPDDGGWWQDQRSSGSSKSSRMQLSWRTDHKTQSIMISQPVCRLLSSKSQ